MQERSVQLLIQPLYLWVQCIYVQERYVLSVMMLYPLHAPIFTVIPEVGPRANRAVVTNNLTAIIEVMIIKGFL